MRYYGSRGELPKRYETLSIQSFSHPTCNLEIFDIKMRFSGVIKNGTREGEFLSNTEEVYYTLSASSLDAFGCNIYHKPNVEFNLLTSNCPGLAPDQAILGPDKWASIVNEWGDNYFVETGTIFTLTSSEGCDDYQPPTPTPQPTDNNTGMIIVIVIVVIIVIIVIIILFIIYRKKNKKHELKKVDKPVENKNDLSAQLPMPYVPNTSISTPIQQDSVEPSYPEVVLPTQ